MSNPYLRKLSSTLGQIKKGFAYDTPLGGYPMSEIILAPDAEAADSVLALTDLANDVTTLVEAGEDITDPDVYRTLRIVGNQASVTGDVVVKGKDHAGRNIEETIALDGTTEVEGVKPFASIDSILLPPESSEDAGDKVSVGCSDIFGLKRPVKAVGDIKFLLVDTGTGGEFLADTITAKSAGNQTYATFAPTEAADGSHNYVIFYETYLI